jgi:hypothetical protein
MICRDSGLTTTTNEEDENVAFRGCEICKQPIEPERAENDPLTRLCAAHAREIAQFGGEFKTVASEDVTSKKGSLKKNIGGVTTERVRNQEAVRRLREAQETRG